MRFAIVSGSLSVVSIGAMSEPVSTISKESRAAIDTWFEKDSPHAWLRYSQGHREYEPMDISIGRELYTAPFIWVNADKCNIVPTRDKFTCYDRFKVAKIQIDENEDGRKRITGIRIVNEKTGQIVFSWKEN